MTKLDMGGVSTGFEPVPEDVYTAALTDYEVLDSKSSGKPMVKLEFTVSEGQYEGRKLWQNHSLQPQALFGLKGTLVAMGVDEEVLSEPFELEELLAELIGEDVRLDVGTRVHEGTTYNNITKIRASTI